ncbi:hypothetical protein M9Y10_002369 [Tritrichomonas musculus]|uniref:Copper transporter n=1 Tax=Tritrichomonas musculus TaxID=1915356 RepID=A0ABR2LAL0_9EUKA
MAEKEASQKTAATPTQQQQVQFPEQSGFSGWLSNIFTPGVGFGVINFTRVCLVAMMVFLVYMVLFNYNIHWLVMSILGICLTCSFEFFVSELKKNPEIMDPANKKDDETKDSENNDETKNTNKEKND